MQETLFPPRPLELKPQRHLERIVAILRHYAARGRPLADLTQKHMLNRSLRTLRHYCITGDVVFPDYTPRHLRKRVAKKKRKSRRSVAA